MARFCRHNRLLADCPICSKGTVLDPARRAERRPRAPARHARSSGPRAAPSATTVRGPYAAAGTSGGGAEVRLERVPGGLRMAEWHAGQISRRAPVLEASHLPALLADAAGKGLLDVAGACDGDAAPAGTYGASAGRTGDFREELRVERLDGERVRIARWVQKPGAGWQLQEAPVLLPAARFAEALEAAVRRGVLER
jgi:hypothetical protein